MPSWEPIYDPAETRVTLGALAMSSDNAGAARDVEAVTVVSEIAGWYDSPADATEVRQHWTGQGNVLAGPALLAPRLVKMRGWVSGDSAAGVLRAVEALGRFRAGTLVVDERRRGLAREADMRRLNLAWDRKSPIFQTFELSMIADDPLRYGSGFVALSNGANAIPNRGAELSFPVLELTGPHNAITITHPGGAWTFPALSSGSRVIDMRTGDVWSGTARTFPAVSGPWARVPAGGGTWTVAGLGSGSARVRRFEAWS